MNVTLSWLQRDVTLLRSQLAPPPAPMPILEMAARLGLTLDSWQVAAVQSEAPRVLLNIHRQGGKALLMALLGLHAILSQPRSLVLTISPTERQSGLLFRQLLDFYRRLGSPVPSTIENRLSLELGNGSAVYALPGSEANIRGFSGVDLILADEASRIDDAMMGAVRPMLSVSNGRLDRRLNPGRTTGLVVRCAGAMVAMTGSASRSVRINVHGSARSSWPLSAGPCRAWSTRPNTNASSWRPLMRSFDLRVFKRP